DHTSDECFSDRHLHDASGALYEIAFFDFLKITEQHRANFVLFQVERQTANVMRKLKQLAGHDFFKTVKFCDTVSELDHCSYFGDRNARFEVFDLFANDLVDFAGSNWFHNFLCPPATAGGTD